MRVFMKTALVAVALAGASIMAGQSAKADNVTVHVGPAGGIAFGYHDGYWDRAHAWHPWRDEREAAAWRAENREHYYDWKHDRDGDGWRAERWWDRH